VCRWCLKFECEGAIGVAHTDVRMGDGTVIKTEDALDDGSECVGNLNGTGVAAVGSIGMLEADKLHVEGLFHIGRGAGQSDGPAENFVAAREYLQIVLGGELPDEVDLGGVSAIGFGEVGVAENLAAMFVEVEGLAVLR